MSAVLNEQEQVDLIKDYWKRYGNFFLSTILVIAIGMVGWRYWQNQQLAKKNDASSRYQSLLVSFSSKHMSDVNAKAQDIISTYPSTVYASMSSLILAAHNIQDKQYKQAKNNLHWVLAHSRNPAILATTNIRLARLLIATNHPKAALQKLQNIPLSFSGVADMIKGDIYRTSGNTLKAHNEYLSSLKQLSSTDPLYTIVNMKLNDLPNLTKTPVKKHD